MRQTILFLTLAVSLAACSQPTTPADGTLYGAAFQPTAGAHLSAASTTNGQRIWSDGQRMWSDSFRMWSDGQRMWSDGQRMWSDGTFQPAPDNTAAFRLIGLDRAQARAPRLGAGVTVAIIDTGVDADHPVLRGSVTGGHDYLRDLDDGAEGGRDGDPAYGHGTAVASMVLQVAPDAKLLSMRVIGPDGSGSEADVARAIRDAADRGANIINLSVSGAAPNGGVRAAIVDVTRRGVLVVGSAGNTGAPRPEAPAVQMAQPDPAGERALSVSGTDNAGTLTAWTNRGSEVNAPGVALTAAYPDGRAVHATGTSFSAPLVSGTLALALGQGARPADLADELKDATRDGLLDAATLLSNLH
ncbi:S8 family peptidase [Deinococcus maricopensis]|uniref:Peptidase S8 and S53 subtilisin kexin sedolisin n=1 Tax=Deinococcus maricopensis (strain DSM 21211 / LMG 22137 / NRRL B-23946 / LB-34) TaxID=709986 RepID=E8U8X5_DEIML|nr:S8 family serine peptidase [Deinococcus maricopensis]ADV67514.1 peptidase S8 and S53 subtilisin kexin sedolisin [Deinococcus maricopensis DSM 21211]